MSSITDNESTTTASSDGVTDMEVTDAEKVEDKPSALPIGSNADEDDAEDKDYEEEGDEDEDEGDDDDDDDEEPSIVEDEEEGEEEVPVEINTTPLTLRFFANKEAGDLFIERARANFEGVDDEDLPGVKVVKPNPICIRALEKEDPKSVKWWTDKRTGFRCRKPPSFSGTDNFRVIEAKYQDLPFARRPMVIVTEMAARAIFKSKPTTGRWKIAYPETGGTAIRFPDDEKAFGRSSKQIAGVVGFNVRVTRGRPARKSD